MFTPHLHPDLWLRAAPPAVDGLPPRPSRPAPRRGASAPGGPAAPQPAPAPVLPESSAPARLAVPPPLPAPWRVWIGRRLIGLGQRMAGDGRPGVLRLVGGAK